MPTKRQYQQYPQIIRKQRYAETAENVDEINAVIAIRIHTEKASVEYAIQNYANKELNIMIMEGNVEISYNTARRYAASGKTVSNRGGGIAVSQSILTIGASKDSDSSLVKISKKCSLMEMMNLNLGVNTWGLK